jgi:hypothetical protein
MTTLAEAIERHKEAQAANAAFNKRPDYTDEIGDRLFEAERKELAALVAIPCASDAEFMAKLRYVFAHEMEVEGDSYDGDPFATVLETIDVHFDGEPRA